MRMVASTALAPGGKGRFRKPARSRHRFVPVAAFLCLAGTGHWLASRGFDKERREEWKFRNNSILRLFCPTPQALQRRLDRRIHRALKPLILLAPATVHGVVFEVFDSRSAGVTVSSAESPSGRRPSACRGL